MSEPLAIDERRVHLETTDGVTLVGDLASPSSPRAAAVLLHPHPQYGGDRHNPVIAALHAALPSADIASLRFDFRSEFTGGPGERLDAVAAIDRVLAEFPDVPVAVIGYSFGAWVALGLQDVRVRAVAAIAPPLAVMSGVPRPVAPTFVITPAHDQFSPPAENLPVVERWRADGGPEVEHVVVEMADHFLAGSIVSVATQVTAWIAARR
jgi:alpha/beta superfamily hydrolase